MENYKLTNEHKECPNCKGTGKQDTKGGFFTFTGSQNGVCVSCLGEGKIFTGFKVDPIKSTESYRDFCKKIFSDVENKYGLNLKEKAKLISGMSEDFKNDVCPIKKTGISIAYGSRKPSFFICDEVNFSFTDERKKYFLKNPPAWCEEFINKLNKNTMNKAKQPIGYKLKNGCEAYIPAIQVICRITDFKNIEKFQMAQKGWVFHPNSVNAQELKEAGVLDLWFEPVYEIEITKKIFTLASDKIEVVITNKKSIKIKEDFLPIELLETIHSIRHAHFYQPRANKHWEIDVVSAKFKVNNYYMSLIEIKAIMDIYAELNNYKHEH